MRNGERDEFEEELRVARIRKGTSRSRSRATEGYDRDLTRDMATGDLTGPTESRPATRDDIRRVLGPAAPTRPPADEEFRYWLAGRMVEELSPYLRELTDWTVDVSARGLGKGWTWIQDTLAKRWEDRGIRRHQQRASVNAAPGSTQDAARAEGDVVAVDQPAVTMTLEEYRETLWMVLAADEFVRDRKRVLANALIIDEEGIPKEVRDVAKAALGEGLHSLDLVALQALKGFFGDMGDVELDFMLPVPAEPLELSGTSSCPDP